jgi:outer membrane protein TolC
MQRRCTALAVAVSVFLSGCSSFTADRGFTPVRQFAEQHLNQNVQWPRTAADRERVQARVTELLATPLTADAAVQIALLNNRALQASFQQLGLAEADRVQAGRWPNPGISLRRAQAGSAYTIEQSITFNLMALVALPLAREVEQRRFAQTQLAVALEVVQLATGTRKAWVRAVAAAQNVVYMEQVQGAAESSAELARSMVKAGNWSTLNQAREQGFYNDAVQGLARARLAQVLAREALTRQLGLSAASAFTLPEQLPDLPDLADFADFADLADPAAKQNASADLTQIESQAMAMRLDLQAVRAASEAQASNLGLTRTTRFINVLEIGPTRVLEGARSDPYRYGYEVRFELPLFDGGGARLAKAEAQYQMTLDQAAASAVNARSEVRAAWQSQRSYYALARQQRDAVLPLRKHIADENLLRYNGMLISVFELIADAREQTTAVIATLDAVRDFWIADVELAEAMGGALPARTTASAGDPK